MTIRMISQIVLMSADATEVPVGKDSTHSDTLSVSASEADGELES